VSCLYKHGHHIIGVAQTELAQDDTGGSMI